MNAHVACEREKFLSHTTGKIWTMFKNTILGKKEEEEESGPRREKKKQFYKMSCVHSARSIMRVMIKKENDGICKEWKGQDMSIKFWAIF